MSARSARAAVIALAVVGAATPADAITSCSFTSVSAVSFGAYDVFDVVPLASTGTIVYRCSGVGANETVVVDLSAGNSGNILLRTLASGANQLNYNLYLDAAHTLIWGNGVNGTSHHGPTTPPEAQDVSVTIFGLVPEQQTSVPAGSYADTIVVTILF